MLHHDLKRARIDAGLSMDDAADRLGVSRSALSRIEGGVTSVSSQRLIVLAGVYGVSPSSLLDGAVVRAMSDTDLDRIGRVIEFVEEVLADQSPRPDPKVVRETVLAIFKQETALAWDTGAEFDPARYRELIRALVSKK